MSFTQLNPSDFVVSSDAITAPAWSSNVPTLTSFFTATTPTTTTVSAGAYYLNVYQQAYGSNGAADISESNSKKGFASVRLISSCSSSLADSCSNLIDC